MRQHVLKHFGFLKTTLLGGVVFLLPLIVIGALLGQAGQIVVGIVVAIRGYLTDDPDATIAGLLHLSPVAYVLITIVSIAILIGLCFAAGMIARRSLGRWFTDRAERYLLMLFPRYAVFKDQLTGNLGGGTLRPVLVQTGPFTRVGMEVERTPAGNVTIYFPGAPDPWSGRVEIVEATGVTPIEAPFIDVMTTFEQLGRGLDRYVPPTPQGGPVATSD